MDRFISYVRVSTDRQGRSGLGLEAQTTLIQQYVDREGAQLLETVLEVESGSLDQRPGLQRALALCRKHKAILLLARLDRLGRRLSFIAQLLDADVDVRVAEQPGASKLTLQLLAIVAEAERDLIRDRTRQALAAAKARGTILGKHGRLLAAQAVEAAHELQRQYSEEITTAFAQSTNLREAAAHLTRLNVPTRAGGAWGPSNVSRLKQRLGLHHGMPA